MPSSPSQIRAARSFIGWSILDLAVTAHISVATVRRCEEGDPRSAGALAAITAALETAGISFLADDGSGTGLRFKAQGSRAPDLHSAGGSLSA